jgi:hypothetical protein
VKGRKGSALGFSFCLHRASPFFSFCIHKLYFQTRPLWNFEWACVKCCEVKPKTREKRNYSHCMLPECERSG